MQGLVDQGYGVAQGLMRNPMDWSGLPDVQGWQNQQIPGQGLNDWGQVDFSKLGAMPDSGFGSVPQVQQAMMGLMQPGLDAQAAAARQRAAASGLQGGERAMGAVERGIGTNQNQANMQALLAGTQEYGNIFNRGMQARQQGVGEQLAAANYANALRGQQFGEQGAQ